MVEAERRGEALIIPKVGDVIVGNFGAGLPHLVVKVAERSVEAGAIHTYEDGKEEMTPPGTIPNDWIDRILGHWDIDRMMEAVVNNMAERNETVEEILLNIRQELEVRITSTQQPS